MVVCTLKSLYKLTLVGAHLYIIPEVCVYQKKIEFQKKYENGVCTLNSPSELEPLMVLIFKSCQKYISVKKKPFGISKKV